MVKRFCYVLGGCVEGFVVLLEAVMKILLIMSKLLWTLWMLMLRGVWSLCGLSEVVKVAEGLLGTFLESLRSLLVAVVKDADVDAKMCLEIVDNSVKTKIYRKKKKDQYQGQ